MQEATTSEVADEGIAILDSGLDDAISEAPEEIADEDLAENGPQQEEEFSELDLSDVPEEMRGKVKDYAEREFKRAWTKKTQKLAAENKTKWQELESLKNQTAEWTRVAQEVLSDPTRLNYYRQQFGYGEVVQEPKETPKVETVEDLLQVLDQRLADAENRIAQKAQSYATQKVQSTENIRSWRNAVKQFDKDEIFQKYKTPIVSILKTDPEIRAAYQPGNEYELIQSAKEKFTSLLQEDLEKAKQEALASLKVKKSARTLAPQKTMATSQGSVKSKEQALADIDRILAERGL